MNKMKWIALLLSLLMAMALPLAGLAQAAAPQATAEATAVPEADAPEADVPEGEEVPEEVVLPAAYQAYLDKVDPEYGHQLALRLAEIRDNPDLGYRTAGSPGELATGDLLAEEMRAIGLQDVTKDAFTLDTWTFEKANLSFTAADGSAYSAILGAYQTQFVTDGAEAFTVVYGGQGTEADLADLDVEGKLVLIDINQRENWWINYPAYEAHLKGAAAVLAAQDGGYSEISDEALNAQDICGPADAPAFSISRKDADALRAAMGDAGEVAVQFDAVSNVGFDGTSYNVWGTIPGRDPDKLIILSAHYDSYFDGFQDDNAAIGLMMGIAKAMLDSGYQPEKTLVFCAMAAEEWGVSNSRYDWSTGAYNQIFRVRPEWAGKAMANINFELPAYTLDYATNEMRAGYELMNFIGSFIGTVPQVDGVFPDGVGIITPTQTWSDDFSMSIAGIPATVNSLREDFATLYYHSQLDDANTYDAGAYTHQHYLYGLLALAYDRCAVPPLDFTTRLFVFESTISKPMLAELGLDEAKLTDVSTRSRFAAYKVYERIAEINRQYAEALDAGDSAAADAIIEASGTLYTDILAIYKDTEDALVRLTWEDVSVFPHELPQTNLTNLYAARDALEAGDAAAALDNYLWAVDNNWYAYDFSYETYRFFTDQVLTQDADRLMWGAGRTMGHEDLHGVIRTLTEKLEAGDTDFTVELEVLAACIARQEGLLAEAVDAEIAALTVMTDKLAAIAE